MKLHIRHLGRQLQGGIVAVEMAFILLFVLVLLPYPLFFGRVFWHYAVLQKVAHDAARYMSTIPAIDMKNAAKASQAAALAQSMVAAGTAGLGEPVGVNVMCDAATCGTFSVLPGQVRIIAGLSLQDTIFGAITGSLTGDSGLLLQANVTMRYANN
jgi:Flp pilus assembly protein TadG